MENLRNRVMPCMKAAVVDENGPSLALRPEDTPIFRDLGNGLLVLYVVDAGHSFEFVQNRHLAAAGLDPESLHAAAMINLLAFSAERARIQAHGSIFGLFVGGNFEASLLLVDSLWDESLAGYARNGFVVAVPSRDVLAFADAASESGLAELRNVVSRVYPCGDHLISPDLFRRRAGRWVRVVA